MTRNPFATVGLFASTRPAAWSLVLMALVAATAVAPRVDARQPPAVVGPVVRWTADDRFGMDADGDGRMDLPNTSEYVHNRRSSCSGACPPTLFALHFDAGLSGIAVPAMAGLPILTYQWIVSGASLDSSLHYVRTAPHLDLSLAEGEYSVEMRMLIRLPWARLTTRTVEAVTVEDLLIVAIGDSYASGEGNPEVRRTEVVPALWAEGGSQEADAANSAAHRSTVAWPARVALAMERADRHTSVTFVSMAATNARIDAGIVAAQGAGLTVSQLDALRAVVGERRIDLLLIQEGGNDIGFSRVVRGLVEADPLFDPVCYDQELSNVFDSVRDGDWTRGAGVTFDLPFRLGCRVETRDGPRYPGLVGLAEAFDRVAAGLAAFDIERVLLVGYPDPTGSDAEGTTCDEIVGDTTPPLRFHEIDEKEQARAVAEVLNPLNAALASIAAAQGWHFVGGVAEPFARGHGYCAPWPDYGYPTDAAGRRLLGGLLAYPDAWYRNPGKFSSGALVGGGAVTWYRTAAQSSELQGPDSRYATTGTLHPNEIGHEAIARLVLAALAAASG